MAYEFECKCGSFTIFKEINGLRNDEKVCARCLRQFSIDDLVSFDRSDKDVRGILVSTSKIVEERLKALVSSMEDLADRFDRIETIVLDEHCDDEETGN